MSKLMGVYITKDDLDKIIKPLIKRQNDDYPDIPLDAKLISVWFDFHCNALLLSYEHESFGELPKHPILEFKYVVEPNKEGDQCAEQS